ncbi:MAG: ADP-ribosylglycohydrolase family protein [Rhodospirillaceae bacterium]|nr:ADP-ribosylglycohydrolase family protein [Rhodospirillaceae bacterium]
MAPKSDVDVTLSWPSALPEAWRRAHDATCDTPCSPDTLNRIKDRGEAAYLGLAIGDALGATTEFLTPREIKAQFGVHKDIVGGGWLHLKPGHVTDDTEMSLALGRAIHEHGGIFSAQAAAEAFSTWMSRKPVDIGHTVRRGISAYRRTGLPFVADNPMNAGNGGAMRVLPVALATLGAPWDQVLRAIRLQAHVTHTCRLADAGTEIVVALIQTALRTATPGTNDLTPLVEIFSTDWPEFSPNGKPETNPSGFIVHTLRAVFQALLLSEGFETGLINVVNRGGDADTTGAILGMILGATHGTTAIPKRWIKKLNPVTRSACIEQAHALLGFSPAIGGTHRTLTL